jgi:pimeloyl-ACP methyl ester carboxylesterase
MQTPALAEHYRVFLTDRRGHGKAPDTDAPFSYDEMASETIEFLEHVVGGPSALVGWSDGGIVSLFVSLRRPDLVKRQVLIGANFMVLADIVARIIVPGQVLPIGVVTALVGAPAFALILYRARRRA